MMYYPSAFNVEWARKISGLFDLSNPGGSYLMFQDLKKQKISKIEMFEI